MISDQAIQPMLGLQTEGNGGYAYYHQGYGFVETPMGSRVGHARSEQHSRDRQREPTLRIWIR